METAPTQRPPYTASGVEAAWDQTTTLRGYLLQLLTSLQQGMFAAFSYITLAYNIVSSCIVCVAVFLLF